MLVAAIGLTALLQQAAAPAGGSGVGVAPGAGELASWDAFLPAAHRFPLRDRAGHPLPSADFERRLRRLAEQPLGELHRVPVTLGDLVRSCAAARWERPAVDALLVPWEAQLPAEEFAALRDLVHCEDLYAADWDPDSGRQRAGFHFGPAWELADADFHQRSGDHDVLQSANLVLADLQAYGEAARQWPAYLDFVGNSYESLEPVPEDHWVVRDAFGAVVMETLRARVHCDLPFPFGSYRVDLRMLNRAEPDGAARSWFHGASDELHWYAGYDLFVPVRDGAGALVGLLQLRQTGFDLVGVPEGSGDRRNGIRTIAGNLRLRAERRWAAAGARAPFDRAGALPAVAAVVPLD